MNRILRRLFLLLLLQQGFISAEELRPLSIDAECVEYEGKEVHLTGHAVVEHELGKVEADQIWLFPEKEGKKMAFFTFENDRWNSP
jgi:lipopolysaccharide export system protein LptA